LGSTGKEKSEQFFNNGTCQIFLQGSMLPKFSKESRYLTAANQALVPQRSKLLSLTCFIFKIYTSQRLKHVLKVTKLSQGPIAGQEIELCMKQCRSHSSST
jgi:hypothetical protein